MAEIMRDPENDAAVRLSAAKALVERAAGRPHQAVSIENDVPNVILINEATAAAVMLEEFGDRGALPEHGDVNEDGDGEPS